MKFGVGDPLSESSGNKLTWFEDSVRGKDCWLATSMLGDDDVRYFYRIVKIPDGYSLCHSDSELVGVVDKMANWVSLGLVKDFCQGIEDNIARNVWDKPADVDSVSPDPGSKYIRTIVSRDGTQSIPVDIYSVLDAYKVTCPAMAHAIKKLLMPGQRGAKSYVQDLEEAIPSITRAIQLANQEKK